MQNRLEFEETPCFKESCIHLNQEDKICNLNGMALNDNLRRGFKCGNLNKPDAKKTYFPKPEKIDLKIDLITEEDQKFQEFQDIFKNEIERILSKSNDSNLQSMLKEGFKLHEPNEIIFEPGFFNRFGQCDESFLEKKEKLIQLLNYLLPYSEDNIEFWIPLDSRIYFISLSNVYNCLFENSIELYIRNKNEFSKFFLELINNWRKSFKTRIIQYELIIPLKGLYFSDLDLSRFDGKRVDDPELIKFEKESTFYGQKFINFQININGIEKECSIDLKPTGTYIIFKKEKSIAPRFNHVLLTTVSYFPLIFRGINRAPSISDSKLWQNLKEILQCFFVCGIKLSIGKPFYKFPWWISKKLIENISFAIPEWMSTVSMWLEPVEPLIPDLFIPNIGLDFPFDKERTHDGDVFFGTPKILEQGMQSKGSGGYTQSLSIVRDIYNLYQKLKNPKLPYLSFKNNNIRFLLGRLLQLGQCSEIEDTILTACIILESIGTSERTRMLMIISIIVSETKDEFLTYFKKRVKLFDKLYKVRNSIIHGRTNTDENYRDFARLLLNKEELTKDEAFKKKGLILLWLFELIAEIIKNIISKDINIKDLRESHNYTNYLEFKS